MSVLTQTQRTSLYEADQSFTKFCINMPRDFIHAALQYPKCIWCWILFWRRWDPSRTAWRARSLCSEYHRELWDRRMSRDWWLWWRSRRRSQLCRIGRIGVVPLQTLGISESIISHITQVYHNETSTTRVLDNHAIKQHRSTVSSLFNYSP